MTTTIQRVAFGFAVIGVAIVLYQISGYVIASFEYGFFSPFGMILILIDIVTYGLIILTMIALLMKKEVPWAKYILFVSAFMPFVYAITYAYPMKLIIQRILFLGIPTGLFGLFSVKQSSQLKTIYFIVVGMFTMNIIFTVLWVGASFGNLGGIIAVFSFITFLYFEEAEYHKQDGVPYEYDSFESSTHQMQEENIALNIILSFLTFGIYYIIWHYRVALKLKEISQRQYDIVLELVLCYIVPFYRWYWMYVKERDFYLSGVNKYKKDNTVLYLILQIFGLEIIAMALLQSDLNNLNVERKEQLVDTPIISKEDDHLDTIRQLSKLRDEGILTEEEFLSKKKELLEKI